LFPSPSIQEGEGCTVAALVVMHISISAAMVFLHFPLAYQCTA